jgi:anti-sigma B factor antagonist
MASSSSFTLQSQDLPDGKLLAVHGDIDFGSSPDLRQDILDTLQTHPQRLVIDLANVSYMDSSGLATLVEALQQQRQAGRKLILSALQPRVMSIFEIARLHTLFTLAKDATAALTS